MKQMKSDKDRFIDEGTRLYAEFSNNCFAVLYDIFFRDVNDKLMSLQQSVNELDLIVNTKMVEAIELGRQLIAERGEDGIYRANKYAYTHEEILNKIKTRSSRPVQDSEVQANMGSNPIRVQNKKVEVVLFNSLEI